MGECDTIGCHGHRLHARDSREGPCKMYNGWKAQNIKDQGVNLLTISTRSFLTSGSPPVSLTLSTPCEQKSRVSNSTSLDDRSCECGVSATPSSGIQYWPAEGEIFPVQSIKSKMMYSQRKLHLSVREMRR